jgi:single-strand DNA-binding protein
MASYNKVILMGNLTRDPQLSFLPSQTAVVEFGLATSHKYRKQDGSQAEDVCFVDCQMFGKRAEVINKYLKKGNPLFIEGRLKFDSWKNKEGQNRSKLRVFVESFEFMGGGQKSGGQNSGGAGGSQQSGGGGQQQGGGGYSQPQSQQPQQPNSGGGDMGYGQDEEIPF